MGCEVEVLGLTDEFTEADRRLWEPLTPRAFRPRFFPRFGYAPALGRELEHRAADLVHSHGLWMYPFWAAFHWARKHRQPHVLSVRGMLEPWARRYHFWKKVPVWWAWEKEHVTTADVLHATSIQEATNLRRLGLRNPIAVIPNGVDVPDLQGRSPRAGVARTAVFLSRVHPVKGLLNLVEAWRLVRPRGWRLIIAGEDESNHAAEVVQAIVRAGLETQIQMVGPAYGQTKAILFETADLFVLPTLSESFGIAVAEALAYGVPVITTKAAPWKELIDYSCGWWVEAGVGPLARALEEAARVSDTERRAMGERGRRLVEEKFSWPRIARQMKEVYEWVLGGGPKPECVLG